ncbi:MAG: hypothetical protein A2W99_10125 [Bacteroidetes bacterium GWF2_33_16]|nr:MAG: hypothetical protein A2X00_05615 [Bacteroidetes bacterium GWE2_32_14]OFY03906.1 MAG: hypothetical protein A2W99_10125 [Bacteroidetes bacterium GWF2_33_16]
MTINNSSRIVRYNITQFVVLLVYATILSLLVFTVTLDMLLKDINKTTIVVLITLVYLGFLMYNYIIDYNFISFSDNGNKFVFHYISNRPLNKQRKAIEIAKNKFDGYNIERSFFGKKIEIIISIKTQNGVAKYPPLNISALSKTQIILLTKSLKQLD